MTKRRPRLETLVSKDPQGIHRRISYVDSYVREQSQKFDLDLAEVHRIAAEIVKVKDYIAYISMLRRDEFLENVASILAYPLPILSNPDLALEDGRPNWPLVNDLYKYLEFSLKLPLTPHAEMTFEVAQALLSIILSPRYGRRVDLEAGAVMADMTRHKKDLRSFARALLLLQSLIYVKAVRSYPQLA